MIPFFNDEYFLASQFFLVPGIGFFGFKLFQFEKGRTFQNIPTSKMRSVAMGLVEVKGDVASIELPTGSGKGVNAYFCIICGVYVFCRYNISLGRVAIRTQTLENSIQPQAHIFVKDKDPWIEISDKSICYDKRG